MRKEWKIETVNIPPPAPKPPKEKLSASKGRKIARFIKKHWLKSLLIALTAAAIHPEEVFSIWMTNVTMWMRTASGSPSYCPLTIWKTVRLIWNSGAITTQSKTLLWISR